MMEDIVLLETKVSKYSKEIVKGQYQHLIDQEKINITELKKKYKSIIE